MKELLKMFIIFFRIGSLTIGGGYAMIPVIHKELVDREKIVTEDEFLDYIAVAQSIPGIIAVNVSTFIGYKLHGLLGAMVICLAVVLPSFLIIVGLANVLMLYRDSAFIIKSFSGIRPAVIGIMIFSVYKLGKPLEKNIFSLSILLITVIAILAFNIHPIIALIVSGVIGGVYGHFN